MAVFTISRVKNLSTAGPCAKLKFREETKGTSATGGLANGNVHQGESLKVFSASQDRTSAGTQAGQF